MKLNRIINLMTVVVISAGIIGCGGSHGDHSEHATQTGEVHQAELNTIDVPAGFKSDLTVALEAYFELKDALVETNAQAASEKAGKLSGAIGSVNDTGLSDEARQLWTNSKSASFEASQSLSSATDVEVQREYFETISDAFIEMVKGFGPFENTIYRQTCPMVRGGSADWLSLEENVMNPYHGSRMLRCGSVVERI